MLDIYFCLKKLHAISKKQVALVIVVFKTVLWANIMVRNVKVFHIAILNETNKF